MEWQRSVAAFARKYERPLTAVFVVLFAVAGSLATRFVPIKGSELSADWLAYVLVLLAAGTLWWWRTNPLKALAACTVFVVIFWVRDYSGDTSPVLLVLFLAATRFGGDDRRRVWRYVGAALAATLIVATIGVIVPQEDLPLAAVFGLFFMHGTAAAVGEALYQRSQHIAELEQRALAAEADLQNQAELAAVEERTRIAREMHDIIAHGMSSVVVQSLAAQSVVDTDPARAREALETIEAIGRDSVNEMRRMLGVLRADSSDLELEPQPDFEDISELVQRAEDAGVEVQLTTSGERLVLPPGLELTGYRVVQEALTNVVRHAGRPVCADVRITYGNDSLELSVTDDGLGAAAGPSTEGTGHGLLGMAERVEIYNGNFSANPEPGGGFRVHVSLPLPAPVNA